VVAPGPARGGAPNAATRSGARRRGIKLRLLPRQMLEYKFTLGSWARVERDKTSGEIANRILRPEHDTTVDVTVESWARPSEGTSPGAARTEPTRTGFLEEHPGFQSDHLANRRDILVSLPPGYHDAANTAQQGPVPKLRPGRSADHHPGAGRGRAQGWPVDDVPADRRGRPVCLLFPGRRHDKIVAAWRIGPRVPCLRSRKHVFSAPGACPRQRGHGTRIFSSSYGGSGAEAIPFAWRSSFASWPRTA
jgi:hypothetical protein